MNVLVTGVTGYIGSLVAARLIAEGHTVRGFARRPDRARIPGLQVVGGDAVTGEGLAEAFSGVEVAYFLIHSMESAADPFGPREAQAAHRFAQAAHAAGVQRIVYLGGPVPPGPPSAHLKSRLAVERVLLDAVPDSVALRASIVIGARSRSFRLLVRLVERMPVMPLPSWGSNRSAPVDERDVLVMLVRAADADLGGLAPGSRALDAAGSQIVSYGHLIGQIAEAMLVDRPAVGLRGVTVTPLTSAVAAAIAGEDPGFIRPLMESLSSDLLPTGQSAAEVLTVRLHSLDSAIEHALGEWEQSEPLAAR